MSYADNRSLAEAEAISIPHSIYYEAPRWSIRWLNQQRIQRVLALAEAGPGQRVLEAGCGDGYLLAALAATGAEVVGCDLSRLRCHRSRIRLPETSIVWMDIFQPAFRRASFDVVIAADILEHLPDPAAALALLDTLLVRKGRLVVSVPNEPLEIMLRALLLKFPTRKPDHPYWRLGPIFRRYYGRPPDRASNIPPLPFPFCLHRIFCYHRR